MSKPNNNERIRTLSEEETMRLCQFFHILLKVDMRIHPEKYKSCNGNTERADALLTYQAKEEDQASK